MINWFIVGTVWIAVMVTVKSISMTNLLSLILSMAVPVIKV